LTPDREQESLLLRVRWQTEYRYEKPARASHNELRVLPQTQPGQEILREDLRTAPAARPIRHRDAFGNTFVHFDVLAPHERLVVEMEALVRRRPALAGPLRPLSPFERHIYALPTERAPDHPRIWALASEIARALPGDADPVDRAEMLTDSLRDRFEFLPGVTDVASSALHILEEGAGVCQDFTHLFLGVARHWGLVCRYVGGYLAADGQHVVTDAAHAWAQVWDPEGGWTGFDPANRCREDLRYVIAAVGRDYLDTAPVKGVYRGTGDATWTARLELAPLGGDQQ
jgi:transglutaminase-like putative cysteine protease